MSLHSGLLAEDSGIEIRAISGWLEDGGDGVLLYLLAAPEDLPGWTIAPKQVTVVDGAGKSISVTRASTLVNVGRVSLAAVSFSVGDISTGTVSFRFDDLTASKDGMEARSLEGMWTVSPIERRDVPRVPQRTMAFLVIGSLPPSECLEIGGIAVTFWSARRCPGFEQWEVAEPTAPDSSAPRPGATATPAPGPPAPWVQVFTYKFYSPEVKLFDVGVARNGKVGVISATGEDSYKTPREIGAELDDDGPDMRLEAKQFVPALTKEEAERLAVQFTMAGFDLPPGMGIEELLVKRSTTALYSGVKGLGQGARVGPWDVRDREAWIVVVADLPVSLPCGPVPKCDAHPAQMNLVLDASTGEVLASSLTGAGPRSDKWSYSGIMGNMMKTQIAERPNRPTPTPAPTPVSDSTATFGRVIAEGDITEGHWRVGGFMRDGTFCAEFHLNGLGKPKCGYTRAQFLARVPIRLFSDAAVLYGFSSKEVATVRVELDNGKRIDIVPLDLGYDPNSFFAVQLGAPLDFSTPWITAIGKNGEELERLENTLENSSIRQQ